MKRSYDVIAPVYDRLVKLIFGTSLRKAQTHFLSSVPPSSRLLIAGGGTGWILEEITALYPQDLVIDYLDVSEQMIRLSKQKKTGNNKVNFIHQSIFLFAGNKEYDVIITPFFFDNFKEENAKQAFVILHHLLAAEGLWLYTDFQIKKESSYWQKTLLFMMYSFFRIAANIEASTLPDIAFQFRQHGYHLTAGKTFLQQFIITSLYKKPIPTDTNDFLNPVNQ